MIDGSVGGGGKVGGREGGVVVTLNDPRYILLGFLNWSSVDPWFLTLAQH